MTQGRVRGLDVGDDPSPTIINVDSIPARDRQTDRRTDGRTRRQL